MTALEQENPTVAIEGDRLRVRKALRLLRGYALPIFMVLLIIVIAILEPRFAELRNLQNLLRQASVLAMMAAGQAFPILVGGLDISVGAQVAIVSIVTAMSAKSVGVVLAMFIGVASGGLIGLVNGGLISKLRLSPIIVTLGLYSILRGLALVISDGQAIRSLPDGYTTLGASKIGPVATPTIVALVLFGVLWVVLTRTRLGRYIYAVGGSEETTRLSGVDVVRVKALAYMICGLATGLAAVVLSSRVGSGEPNLGVGMEMDAIAAVFIGGVAWGGGEGSLAGVMLGVLLLSILSNGLNLLGIPSYIQSMVIGALIIVAVGADEVRRRSAR